MYPGVIIDALRHCVYIMAPDGQIDALDLKTGVRRWSSNTAAKPLGLVRNQLLAQAEHTDGTNNLTVVTLNPVTGAQLLTGTIPLPATVHPAVSATTMGDFVTSVRPYSSDALVTWQFRPRVNRGSRNGLLEHDAPINKGMGPVQPDNADGSGLGGAFKLNLATGATASVSAAVPIPNGAEIPVVPLSTSSEATPLVSIDGLYTMMYKRISDDRNWESYVLSVSDQATSKQIVHFQSHFSVVPFYVWEQTIIFVTQPYQRVWKKQVINRPVEVRSVNLKTGKEVWYHTVRDPAYRGPLPP